MNTLVKKNRSETLCNIPLIRKNVILLLIAFFPFVAFAQSAGGQIKRPERKKQTTKIISEKKQSTKHVEFEVTIVCNVPSAEMIIDGHNSGKACGSRILKTGLHTINLSAEGYNQLSQTIRVNSSSRYFKFNMEKIIVNKEEVVRNLVNNMVRVEGGTVKIGATIKRNGSEGFGYDYGNENIHYIEVSSFYICRFEVTQEEWEAIMNNNPSKYKGAKRPVENVTWDDCQAFIQKLNELTGKQFRLPTEFEWEFAARGGTQSYGYKYAGSNNLDDVAWYDFNCYKINPKHGAHEVGMKSPNELGLYDMQGNVCEWCYAKIDNYDTNNKSLHQRHIALGGGWSDPEHLCGLSHRYFFKRDYQHSTIGLRLAL